MTCAYLNFLKVGLNSPKVGLIKKSLLWMLLFLCCCHFVLILGFKSVYEILNLSGVNLKSILLQGI